MVERDNLPEVLRFVRIQQLDLKRCDSAYIVVWIKSVMQMRKKAKTEVLRDIRQYFDLET